MGQINRERQRITVKIYDGNQYQRIKGPFFVVQIDGKGSYYVAATNELEAMVLAQEKAFGKEKVKRLHNDAEFIFWLVEHTHVEKLKDNGILLVHDNQLVGMEEMEYGHGDPAKTNVVFRSIQSNYKSMGKY